MLDFLNDTEVLSEAQLPPLVEFDTIYYYYMGSEFDTSIAAGSYKIS